MTTPDLTGAPPFFIVGNERSGTTMLRIILDRCDQVAIPTESMFIVDYARVRAGARNLADHTQLRRFVREIWNHPRVRLWNIGEPAPEPPTGLRHADAYRWAVEAPYLAVARREGKSRWADKTPVFVHSVDEIKAVWPDAKFVELVRDGRDVSLSVQNVPFGGNDAWHTGRVWARGIRAGRAARERYPGDVLTVRYEDLTADPATHVRAICEFVDLPYSDDMLRVEQTDESKLAEGQAGWFTQLWSGINQGSVEKWRTRMSARDQRTFVRVAGRELAQFGYDLDGHDPDARTPVLTPLADVARAIASFASRAVDFVRLHVVQERGREVGWILRRKLSRR